jgi:2-polyprenyl-3-methyl-5-hydroxy-6-metoxy-1,4-benzoquinol methylase
LNNPNIEYYQKHAQILTKRYETAVVTELHLLLKSAFPAGARLLEIGCGSGRDAAFMLANGFDIVATDGVDEMLASAAFHHPELSGRLFNIRLPEELSDAIGPFDGVYAIATLMHLSRPELPEVFKKINRLLRPHGRLFFSVPLKRDDMQTNDRDHKGRRFTAMTADNWRDLCRKNGFDIIATTISGDGLGRNGISWLNCLAQDKNL